MLLKIEAVKTKEDAEILWPLLIKEAQEAHPDWSNEKIIDLLKENIGYMGGYYSLERRQQLETWFNCVHPILGSAFSKQLSSEEAFKLGIVMSRLLEAGRKTPIHKQPK